MHVSMRIMRAPGGDRLHSDVTGRRLRAHYARGFRLACALCAQVPPKPVTSEWNRSPAGVRAGKRSPKQAKRHWFFSMSERPVTCRCNHFPLLQSSRTGTYAEGPCFFARFLFPGTRARESSRSYTYWEP